MISTTHAQCRDRLQFAGQQRRVHSELATEQDGYTFVWMNECCLTTDRHNLGHSVSWIYVCKFAICLHSQDEIDLQIIVATIMDHPVREI